MGTETYFLSSLESARFEPVRACTIVRRLAFRSGKECALVRVSPGVPGREFGLSHDQDLFVLANRHEGETLSPIATFPCFVFIARPLIDIEDSQVLDTSDVDIVAWGELYRTCVDAEHHTFG